MIGRRIRQIRREKGLSLAELSKRTDIVQTYLNIIEQNLQSDPAEEYIVRIATALGVDVAYLLEGTGKEEKLSQPLEHFLYLRKYIMKMDDQQLVEMKDLIEYTMWKRARLGQAGCFR